MSTDKLDIFEVLSNADMGNRDYYRNLEEDRQKLFTPLVAMRWLSSIPDSSVYKDYMLLLTNELVNIDFWSLQKHPELQWMLMSLCGSGKKLRHNWVPMSKRKKLNDVHEFMLRWYPSANDMELNLLTSKMSRDDFEEFVKSTGASDEEITKLVKSFTGDETNPKKQEKGKRKRTTV